MKTLLTAFAVLFASLAFAIEPPSPEALAAYRKDGSYAKRLEFALQIGNHRVRPDVAQNTWARLNRLLGQPEGIAPAPLPRWEGMPTKGTNNVLVFLIDFPDYPHVNSAATITSKLFGDGSSSEYPRESLRNFYRRSSYNQLEIRGNTLGWYRMQHNRSWYTTTYPDANEANRAVMQEVIQNYDATHDFSQYDNNHDGQVDYFAVIWAGPDNGWGNFWWGYQWTLNNPVTADGVQFKSFSWQWESRPVGSAYEASTIIHETGHALGLPDYYDYDDSIGPNGGVGGLDMMDAARCDHNGFSKFMLDWLRPVTVPAGSSNVTLRALAKSPDMVVVMPGYSGASPYTQFFFAENRYRTNNDTGNPADGVLIWHVDATPDARGQDFLYNNSYTSHKLLRLMEADGLESIETGNGKADAGDYFNQGESFSDTTLPNSRAYSGTNTYVTIQSISTNGPGMTISASIQGSVAGPCIVRRPATLSASILAGTDAPNQSFLIAASGGTISYALSKSASWLTVTPASGSSSGATNTHTVSFATAALVPGLYNADITVTSVGASNSPQVVSVSLTVMGNDIDHAVNATNLAWSAGGHSFWFEQTTISRDGQGAAQSGALLDNQNNWIQTTVTGPGLLSFWWKISSEDSYDFLRFYLDGQERPGSISGTVDWQLNSLAIGSNTHTLRWAYTKDASVAAGADAGWVDQVTFLPTNLPPILSCTPASLTAVAVLGQNASAQVLEVWNAGGGGAMTYSISDDAAWLAVSPTTETSSGAPNQHVISFPTSGLAVGTYIGSITITSTGATGSPQIIPVTLRILPGSGVLAEAVDFTNGLWTTGGDLPWKLETLTTHDGQDAAQSGLISELQSSWVELSVQGPGQLSFWWKVSSESTFDSINVLVDGNDVGLSISGEIDWQQGFVEIPSGNHTVTWVYSKDDSLSFGEDAGWLDQVALASGTSGAETLLLGSFNNSSLPSGWSVVDNLGYGDIWAFDNPGGRINYTGGAGGFAIADCDYADMGEMDTELITPALNFTGYTNVVLQFKTDLYIYFYPPTADIDVSLNGGSTWANVWSRSTDLNGTVTLNLPQAAGRPNVKLRFHYTAVYDWWWELDDIRITATSLSASGSGMLAEWRQAWEDFDRNYSYFTVKGIDWAPVYNAYTNAFAQVHDGYAFATQLNNVLQMLHDWQIAVKRPDDTWLSYNGSVGTNWSVYFFTNYTGGVAYQDLRGTHALYHAWVATNLAYIIVNSLDPAEFDSIADADINSLFETYKNAKGLILDLRGTWGGNATNAERIASHFTALPVTYGYTRTRIAGTDHNAFTPYAPRILNPSTGRLFTNQVACLIGQTTISTAEWFTLMMKSSPQVTLIGDRTRGATANAAEFTQTNIGVSYYIPRWVGYTADLVPFEDIGIAPQIFIAPGLSSFDDNLRRDYVLEAAIRWLKRPTLNISKMTVGTNLVVSWPGEASYQYTLLRATNLLNPSWVLAPGWTSNRPGIAPLMRYTNTQPRRFEAYRLQMR